MGEIQKQDELKELKTRADRMGIPYHPSIGVDKLREKINSKLTSKEEPTQTKVPKSETIPQRNARLRREANKLIRARVTCMDPAKKNWPGTLLEVSNSAIGSIKKFIPHDTEDGFHIPKALLDELKSKMHQSFYTVKIDGKKIKRSKLVKTYAIEVLPDLTIDELKKLATQQAITNPPEVA